MIAQPSVLGVAMADELRVMLEIGPKGKRVVAVAPDWPGRERGAKTGEAAVARLQAYLPPYAPMANLSGMGAGFAAIATLHVCEDYPGPCSTTLLGISVRLSGI